MEDDILNQVRIFNRFFTAKLNIFNRYVLGTSYSLVEGRIIGEIGRNDGCNANNIAEQLHMDKSYLSRILIRLESNGLINRVVSEVDSRIKQLSLTEHGRQLYEELEFLSDKQVEDMLSGLSNEKVDQLLKSMHFIQSTLGE